MIRTTEDIKEDEMAKRKKSKSVPARRTIRKRVVRGSGSASIIRRKRRIKNE